MGMSYTLFYDDKFVEEAGRFLIKIMVMYAYTLR